MNARRAGVTPKVSVILPVYNVGPWLPACLDSLKAQTLEHWEAIVVIDGATDDSGAIAQAYAKQDGRFKVIFQKNAGQGAARNSGVAASAGEYLFFLDPDDAVPPNALEVLANKGDATGCDIVLGDMFTFMDGEPVAFEKRPASGFFMENFGGLPPVFARGQLEYELFYNTLFFMVVWMKLFRAEVWKKNGIKAPAGLTMGEDQITVKHMVFVANGITIVPEVVVYYRRRQNSATTRRSKKAFGIFTSYDYALGLYRRLKLSRHEITLLHKAYLVSYFNHLWYFALYRQWPQFFNAISRSVNNWPMKELDLSLFTERENRLIDMVKPGGLFNFVRTCLKVYLRNRLMRLAYFTVVGMRRYLPLNLRQGVVALLRPVLGARHKVLLMKIQLHLVGK
jgi:glycosyltransferase involved in cell wall biosynthesis